MSISLTIKAYECPKCSWFDAVSANVCPRCRTEMREFQLPKEGRVTTFTIIRYPPLGFEDLTPYAVGLIDFDGGHRIIGRIGGDINHLAIGQPVTFVRVVNSAFEFTL